MKKVLIIVHLPRASPRIGGLAKYLPEFGWQPIILTGVSNKFMHLPARIVETPYRDALGFLRYLLKYDPEKEDIRQHIKTRIGMTSKKSPLDYFLTRGGEIINYPCPDKNWIPFALKAAKKIIQEEGIDAVISSSPPVASHLIGSELKAGCKIPWIADIRDLWSQNHNYAYSPLRRVFDRRLELKTMSKVDALVTVSEPWAEELRALHKGKPVYTITHGFDTAEVNIPPAKLTGKFTITYTGTIYTRKQEPSKLFAGLRDLISDKTIDPREIEVRFYGYKHDWLDKEIEQYGLSNIVKQHGVMPRQIVLEKQRESQLLLTLRWEDPQQRGWHSGKIFEYLGARRPILAIGGSDDVINDLLDETKAGVHVPTVEGIKGVLIAFYKEYKLAAKIAYKGLETEINKYSHREMARKFSELLPN
ncbi:glycosyltransferase [Chloroflexota bacterium]